MINISEYALRYWSYSLIDKFTVLDYILNTSIRGAGKSAQIQAITLNSNYNIFVPLKLSIT